MPLVDPVFQHASDSVPTGAGQTGAIGGGFFSGGWDDFSAGAFRSWGGFAGGPGWGARYSRTCSGTTWALGGYAGAGAGVFLTNAENVSDLSGPFSNFAFSAAFGPIGGWFQLSWGKNSKGESIFVTTYNGPFDIPTSLGIGASLSMYPTNTWTAGGK